MRWRWLVVAALALLPATPVQARRLPRPTLTIKVVGVDAEFRTLAPTRSVYTLPAAFAVPADGSRTWTLSSGTYIVAQAPPVDGLWPTCDRAGSTHVFDLRRGDNVTCTYTKD